LWRAEGLSYIREKGADGLRLDLRPQLVLPFRLASYLSGSFGVAPRETFYYLLRTTNASDPSNPFDRTTVRSLAEIPATWHFSGACSLSRAWAQRTKAC
jgi:hypothetical protein